jgi:hypothetical protein
VKVMRRRLLADSCPPVSEAIALEIRRPHSDRYDRASPPIILVPGQLTSNRPYLWPQIYTGLTFLISSLFMLELRRQKWGFRKEKHR